MLFATGWSLSPTGHYIGYDPEGTWIGPTASRLNFFRPSRATVLQAPELAVDIQPWNRRFRAYTEMLKSGSPYEIAKVLRDMSRLKFDKDLSFGERRLLEQAKSLLVKELAMAKQMQQGAMEGEISQILSA